MKKDDISIAEIFHGYFSIFRNDWRIVLVIVMKYIVITKPTYVMYISLCMMYVTISISFSFNCSGILHLRNEKQRCRFLQHLFVEAINIYCSSLNDKGNQLSYDLFTCSLYQKSTIIIIYQLSTIRYIINYQL